MSLKQTSGQAGSVPPVVVIGVALAALLAGGMLVYLGSRRPPATETETRAPARAPVAAPTVASPPPAAEPAPVARAPRKATPAKTAEAPAPAEPAAPTLATLTVEADVPGASVFIDRQFAGTTPLSLERLEPGTKQVTLSADGFSTIQQSVNLSAGPNAVTMRFKEVRLNTTVGVVHKHAMGSCDGMLSASADGLRYDTANKGDAFIMSYAQVESLVVDYLQKNLKVKQKGGKTWNFTDKNPNADALFVFHRDIEAARKKLAEGYAAVK